MSVCFVTRKRSQFLTLIHCPFSWEIWSGVSKDLGVTFIVPLDLAGLLRSWRQPLFREFGKRMWRLVLGAVSWAIWRERNNRVFNDRFELAWQVYRRAKDLILFWAKRCKGYEAIPNGDVIHHWERIIGIGEP